MLTASLKFAILASASVIEARSLFDASHLHGGIHRRQNADASATALAANAIQTGSSLDGSNEIGAAEVGQALSHTSTNNFINNCAGKTLTNGLQITTGSCNGITMGDIPAKTNMVSSIITFPLYGSATIQSDTTFNISVQMANIVAGSFTNADATYYAAPQQLSGGKVIGHTHVTVQDMGKSLNPTTALNPTQFAFFKGINDAGNGKGLLQAVVTGGLPAGNYRVCTMASASNHQPVLMPVAQRGTPDDCTKFTVVGSGTTANAASNDGSGGEAAAAAAQSAVDNPGPTGAAAGGKGASSVATQASATAKAVDTGKGGKNSTSGAEASSSKAANNGKGSQASTSKAADNGKATSSSLAEVSTSKAANDAQSTSSSSSEVVTASKGGKGGKAVSSVSAKATSSSLQAVKFANTTSIAKASKGGNGGKGSQASATSEVSSASVTLSSVGSAVSATSKVSGGGKAVNSQASSGTVVEKVTIIETFFIFTKSLGGLPPSVSKQGESFVCLGEIFTDISSAASAACGHQFNACVGFSGPGFSFEECTSQQTDCGSAASSASAPPAASTVTATATVPVSATVTGSVIAESTVSVSASSAAAGNVAVAQTTSAQAQASASESACSISTGTIFVDAAPTATAAAAVPPFSNSTASTSASSSSFNSTASASSSSSALGGIAAPPVTNSGDATRPFEVNGNTFVNKAAAVQRSCDIQFNACANAVNGGKLTGVTISDCQTQENTCTAAS